MANYTSSHTGAQVDNAITEGVKLGYGLCNTAAATTAKVVNVSNGSYVLEAGSKVTVKFTYAVPANATLNVNSTGAKAIYSGGSAITADIIQAGQIVAFVYDGTNYNLISGGADITIQSVKKSSLTLSVDTTTKTLEIS